MKKIALSVFSLAFAGVLYAAPIDSVALRGAPSEMDSFAYVDVDALREARVIKLILKGAKEREDTKANAEKTEKWLNDVSDIWVVQNKSSTPADSAVLSVRGKFSKNDIFEFVEENKLESEKVGERTFYVAKDTSAFKGAGANVPQNQEAAFVLLEDGRFMGAVFDRQAAGEGSKDSALSVLKKCVADFDEQKSPAIPAVPEIPGKAKEIIRLFVGEGLLKEVAGAAGPQEVRAIASEIPVEGGAALYVCTDTSFETEEIAKTSAQQLTQGLEMLKLMAAMQQSDQPRTAEEEERAFLMIALLSGTRISHSGKTIKFSLTTPEVTILSKVALSELQGSSE